MHRRSEVGAADREHPADLGDNPVGVGHEDQRVMMLDHIEGLVGEP